MKLRIIAGRFRGFRIETPAGRRTRPTREAVREAWFSALGERVEGARILDLYAGSGALGLEALSRGAASVHFVEADGRACAVLRQNLRNLGPVKEATVSCGPVHSFLQRMAAGRELRFDIALADPPYGADAARDLVASFRKCPFAALLCVEHAPGALVTEGAVWHRQYGRSAVSFFDAPSEGASGEQQ